MAIKAKASAQGSAEFKKYVGVGSFRVLGVNPTKEELEKFYGREQKNDPVYITDKQDANDNNKPYKQMRVSFMIQADKEYEDGKPITENEALDEPLKTTVNFFIDSRYRYNSDKTKVQVIDKYGRSAWVPVEQAQNHQIPVYKNGPARLDKDYHVALYGEEALTQFILNYLNVTPIDSYNSNTGQWVTNSNPDDCEGNLDKIKDYFKGDISELKEYCSLLPSNRLKLCVGIRTDNEGRQFMTVYTGMTLRNGSKSYTRIKDSLEGNNFNNDIYSDSPSGEITNIHEYKENVKETNFNKEEDPFAQGAALPDDATPFPNNLDDDPFKNM